jgi:hypothetical protein
MKKREKKEATARVDRWNGGRKMRIVMTEPAILSVTKDSDSELYSWCLMRSGCYTEGPHVKGGTIMLALKGELRES